MLIIRMPTDHNCNGNQVAYTMFAAAVSKASLPLIETVVKCWRQKRTIKRTDRTERWYFQSVDVRRMWLEIRPSKECLEV